MTHRLLHVLNKESVVLLVSGPRGCLRCLFIFDLGSRRRRPGLGFSRRLQCHPSSDVLLISYHLTSATYILSDNLNTDPDDIYQPLLDPF
jgi:hypothetical protein